MDFTFDSAKSDRNRSERGFGFAFAARIFLGRTVELVDDRQDYGEVRVKAIGEISGTVYVVVYTDRDTGRHIISARPANRKERALWQTFE